MIRSTLRGLAAATVLLVAVSSTASAQAASGSRFGLSAGVALPMGDFGDAAETGIHVGGHWQTGLGEKLKLRINADIGRYGLPDGVDGNWMLIGGIANLVYPIATESGFKPYLLGGVGMYNWKIDIDGLGSTDDTNVAFNFGGGFDWGTRYFTEIKYVMIDTEGTSINTLPVTIGIRF